MRMSFGFALCYAKDYFSSFAVCYGGFSLGLLFCINARSNVLVDHASVFPFCHAKAWTLLFPEVNLIVSRKAESIGRGIYAYN